MHHGVTCNFGIVILETHFSYDKDIWITATDYYMYIYIIVLFPLTSILQFCNLISTLNSYKLTLYPMDNCFTGRRDLSRQTPEKEVLYILPAGLVRECAFAS